MIRLIRVLLFWAPRLLGIAVALVLTGFAFDVLNRHGTNSLDSAVAYLILVVAAVWSGALAIGWRWELAGALLFGVLACGFTSPMVVRGYRLSMCRTFSHSRDRLF